jgi:predicted nucleic acid-binding protein
MKVICNTTVISNFAAVNALAILRDVVRELHISTEVYAEIQDGLADGCDFYEGLDAQIYPIAPDGWLHLTAFENDAELRLKMIAAGYRSPLRSVTELL